MTTSYSDLGTNTFHQIIIDRKENGEYSVLDYRVRFVKLMSGGTSEMEDEAKERAISVLQEYRDLMDEFGVEKAGWYATEGLRSLDKDGSFRKEVKEKFGVQIQLISGKEEAEFISSSLAECADGHDTFLGFDIGGGSTELIAHQNGTHNSASYKMGAAVLFKTFHLSEPISREEIHNTEEYIDAFLTTFLENQHDFEPSVLIGASGSLDSVLEIRDYPKSEDEIFGKQKYIEVSYPQFTTIYQEVVKSNLEDRLHIPGMNSKRAEMMTSALIMANQIWRRFPELTLRVSRFSLLMALVNTQAEVYTFE